MGCIIVSMPQQENSLKIRDIIKSKGFWDDIIICKQGSEILEMTGNKDVKIVICMKKLTDMGYEELVSLLPEGITVILLTKDPALVPFSTGVVKLLMPFKTESLIDTIKSVFSIEKRNKKKKYKTPEEQAEIDKAKKYLMEKKLLTEPEAYRYLQKISMDTQRSFVETARMILVLGEEAL